MKLNICVFYIAIEFEKEALVDLIVNDSKVRKTPSWSRRWANFSLL
jgi:hypothetical protein